ncbi:MAG: hypothetical protein FWG11_04065 [Promicromonosporaceae bacterium]|nr:hypothetical protein [Promicromonosporaceae bacterium]
MRQPAPSRLTPRPWRRPLTTSAVAAVACALLTPVALAPSALAADNWGNEYLIYNGATATTTHAHFTFGRTADQVVAGRWGGSQGDTLGLRRGNTMYLDNRLVGGWAAISFTYGRAGDELFVGDWNGNGIDTFAVRRGNTIYVSNRQTSGHADFTFTLGSPGDPLYVGDFNGDGKDTFALRRGNQIYVSNRLDGTTEPPFTFGTAGDEYYVGDWNHNGVDTFATRRGTQFSLSNHPRGSTVDTVYSFGRSGDTYLVGDWNGNGADTFSIRRNNQASPPATGGGATCPGSVTHPRNAIPSRDTTGKVQHLINTMWPYATGDPRPANPSVAWFGGSPEPSAAWVSWIADKAGLSREIGKFGDPVEWANWFKCNDRWGITAVPGAIMFYDKHDDGVSPIGSIDYVAICHDATKPKNERGVDGCGTQEYDRYQVNRRSRGRQVIGYGYPSYLNVR